MKYEGLEQSLSEQIQVLYLTCLGHKPAQVSCQLLEQILTVNVEDPVTQMERVLVASGKQQLAEQVRTSIHKAFQPQLKSLIEKVLQVSIVELLGESNIHKGRTVVTIILAAKPDEENLSSAPKIKPQNMSDLNNE